MDAAEQALKLHDIARLSEGELRGWHRWVCVRGNRPEFDGERAALLSRARELGISLNEASA